MVNFGRTQWKLKLAIDHFVKWVSMSSKKNSNLLREDDNENTELKPPIISYFRERLFKLTICSSLFFPLWLQCPEIRCSLHLSLILLRILLCLFVCSWPVVALLLGSTTHGWTGRVAPIMANWKPSSTTKRKKTPYYESSFTQLSDCIPVVNAARGTFSLMEFNAHCQLLFKLVFSSTTRTDGTLLWRNWAGFAARHHEENFEKKYSDFSS